MVAPFLPEEEKAAAIRSALPAAGAGLYLDTASAGPLPAETEKAMREWAEWELRTGRAGPDAGDEFAARVDEARGTVAAILTAPAERVWLAPSSALGLHFAAEARAWRPGERIVAAGSLDGTVLAALEALSPVLGAGLEVVAAEAGVGSGPIYTSRPGTAGCSVRPERRRSTQVRRSRRTPGGRLPMASIGLPWSGSGGAPDGWPCRSGWSGRSPARAGSCTDCPADLPRWTGCACSRHPTSAPRS